jgi:hypothetical protein
LDRDHVVAAGVDAILSTLSQLDIRHLQSLSVNVFMPLVPFLSVNSQTLHKVHCWHPERVFYTFFSLLKH